jgi:hypothetical protein
MAILIYKHKRELKLELFYQLPFNQQEVFFQNDQRQIEHFIFEKQITANKKGGEFQV